MRNWHSSTNLKVRRPHTSSMMLKTTCDRHCETLGTIDFFLARLPPRVSYIFHTPPAPRREAQNGSNGPSRAPAARCGSLAQAVLERRHWARREPISSMWTVTVMEARQRGGTPTNEHAYELCFVCRLCGAPVRKRSLEVLRTAPRSCVRSP